MHFLFFFFSSTFIFIFIFSSFPSFFSSSSPFHSSHLLSLLHLFLFLPFLLPLLLILLNFLNTPSLFSSSPPLFSSVFFFYLLFFIPFFSAISNFFISPRPRPPSAQSLLFSSNSRETVCFLCLCPFLPFSSSENAVWWNLSLNSFQIQHWQQPAFRANTR